MNKNRLRRAVIVTAAVTAISLGFTSRESLAEEYVVKFSKGRLTQFTTVALRKESKKFGRTLNSKRFTVKALSRQLRAKEVEILTKDTVLIDTKSTNTPIESLHQKGVVRYFEPNFKYRTFATPNDFWYRSGLQWGVNNTGGLGGKVDVDIDAPEAWDISTGSSSVVVAVIDTGIAHRHRDLAANMWRNPKEIPNNRVDDDSNGFVDDVMGYDFSNDDGDPNDDMFHGTHVAGVIGAQGNNGRGLAGVNWTTSLMALKVLNAAGEGDTAGIIRAIEYVIAQKRRGINVRVINASFGGPDDSEAFRESIAAANDAGILVVAAAGNSSADNDATPTYPASYKLPNVITVAALNSSGELAQFSNFGAETVHVGAPGVQIFSTFLFNLYLPMDGTSMAAPYVAGIAALVSGTKFMTPSELKATIMRSTKRIESLEGTMKAPGIVSAYHALKGTTGPSL